ncbi:hypothetical protein B0T11DRAFT_296557 [Plectosphaerella cucumerina]|uniref:Uncharacterized protein n=1 Tax=Plectosphaerella cucumerina TaxID=40658 RepID=A0A8K0TKM9_9PEZI|nr:hypothetical protein B0T11DRAFT_296557 [Plectosphaerella cucumerina]
MKWFTGVAFALVASPAAAMPIPQDEPQSYDTRQDQRTLYKLRVQAENYPQIHDKYLSISNEQVGIYPSQEALAAYATPREDSDYVSLHTVPIGIVDHALVLTGENGLYDLKDTMPQLTDPNPNSTYSWREFVLEEDSDTLLWRAAAEGKWVVFPGTEQGSFSVKWNDGTGFTTQDYLPIEVAFEVVEKP